MKLRKITANELIQKSQIWGQEFDKLLCVIGDDIFVSPLRYDKQFGYYVDNVRGKICVEIEDLDEICVILTGKEKTRILESAASNQERILAETIPDTYEIVPNSKD